MSLSIQFDELAINQHWNMYPQLKSFFKRMAMAELWVLDDEISIKSRLTNWVESLNSDKLNMLSVNLPALLTVLAFQNVESSMYLLQKLEEKLPGLTNSLALEANALLADEKYKRPSMILIERLAAAHTQVSLQELLNNDRLALVYVALKNVKAKRGELL